MSAEPGGWWSLRVRVRRDESAKVWIVTGLPQGTVRASYVRLRDVDWLVERKDKRGQPRVVQAFAEGAPLEIGRGDAEPSEDRVLDEARRVWFDWRNSGQFQDRERQPVTGSGGAEFLPNGSSWAGAGFSTI